MLGIIYWNSTALSNFVWTTNGSRAFSAPVDTRFFRDKQFNNKRPYGTSNFQPSGSCTTRNPVVVPGKNGRYIEFPKSPKK